MAFVCCPLVFEFSVGIGGFVIGLGQIFFFSINNLNLIRTCLLAFETRDMRVNWLVPLQYFITEVCFCNSALKEFLYSNHCKQSMS